MPKKTQKQQIKEDMRNVNVTEEMTLNSMDCRWRNRLTTYWYEQ